MRVIIVLFSVMMVIGAYGQGGGVAGDQAGVAGGVVTRNINQLKDWIAYYKPVCDSLITPCSDKRKIRKDKDNIGVLNKAFRSMTSYSALLTMALRSGVSLTRSVRSGLVNIRELHFYDRAGYLTISLDLTTVDDRVIYAQTTISTSTKMQCGTKGGEAIYYGMDLVYILRDLVREIGFPFHGCDRCGTIGSESWNTSVLANLQAKHPGSVFDAGKGGATRGGMDHGELAQGSGEDSLFRLLTYQTIPVYSRTDVPEEIVSLINNKQLATIGDLLYSPNFNASVIAYEALTYLIQRHLVDQDEKMTRRFGEIVSSNEKIRMTCGYDCVIDKYAYKALGVNTGEIVDKYSKALGQ